jgi:hypothetical protein
MTPQSHPKTWTALTWLVSQGVALFIFVLADFGGPVWMFLAAAIWLLSFGLPTTVSIVVLAALWGHIPFIGTPSLLTFALAATGLSLIAHLTSLHALIRLAKMRTRK